MKVLGLGNGVLREPYALPPEEELNELSVRFDRLGLRNLEDYSNY